MWVQSFQGGAGGVRSITTSPTCATPAAYSGIYESVLGKRVISSAPCTVSRDSGDRIPDLMSCVGQLFTPRADLIGGIKFIHRGLWVVGMGNVVGLGVRLGLLPKKIRRVSLEGLDFVIHSTTFGNSFGTWYRIPGYWTEFSSTKALNLKKTFISFCKSIQF